MVELILLYRHSLWFLITNEEQQIIEALAERKTIDDFSVVLKHDKIKAKNYSFSASQYFDIKIEHIDITPDEFNTRIVGYKTNLAAMFAESKELERAISDSLDRLKYE